jgi:regulatory protein
MTGPRRASQPEQGSERPVRPRGTAKDRALRLLGVRDRSRRELEVRLLRAGFDRDHVDRALDDLARAGLIDDERFAAAVVEHAVSARVAGRRAVMSDLMAKGVDRAVVERAVAPLAATEEERALVLAERRAARLRAVEPVVAFERLSSFLVRRGFAPGMAYSAARRVLGTAEPDGP